MLKLDDSNDTQKCGETGPPCDSECGKKPRYPLVYKDQGIYSITVKPDDHMQFLKNTTAVSRLFEFHQFYSTKFQRIFDSKHYEYHCRVEISEPIGDDICNPPRLHLHGIFKLKTRYSVIEFLLMAMPDLLIHARLQIHELNDPEAWNEYIHKQTRFIPKDYAVISNTYKS